MNRPHVLSRLDRSARVRAQFGQVLFGIIRFAALLAISIASRGALAATNGAWINATSGGLWSNASNWNGGAIADGTDGTADFSMLDITADNTVHLDSSRTIGTLIFGDAATPDANWILDNYASSANILTLGVSSGSPSIQVNNQTATIGAVLAGTHGLTETGAGTLVLTAANTLGGATTVSSGALQLGNNLALRYSTLSVTNSSALKFSPSIGSFTLGGLSGSSSFALNDSSNAAVSLSVGSDGASTAYSGAMSGSGSLTKSGFGTLTLTGANTYSGVTTINSGTLSLGNANALQNSTLTVPLNGNGNVQFQPGMGTFTLGGLSRSFSFSLTDTSGAAVTLAVGNNNANTTNAGPIRGSGSLTKIGTGTLTLTGFDYSYSGNTEINAGVLKLSASDSAIQASTVVVNVDGGLTFGPASSYALAGLAGTNGFSLTNSGNAPVALTVGNNNASTTYSGVMNSAGAMTKIGSGTLTLSGANTFTGLTTITAGVLQLGNVSALQDTTVANDVNGGLAFSPAIGTFTIGGLGRSGSNMTASGNFSLADTGTGPITLQVGSDNASTTYSGVMSGAGSLTKIGTGTLTLKGANTFSGVTTISSGVLQLGNVNALQNSTVAVDVDGGLAFGSATAYTLGGLSGTNSFSLSNSGAPVALTVGNNNASTTYSGAMNGPGALTKIGTGKLTLAGANTFGGNTTINAGVVQLGNANSLQNSSVAVNTSAALAFGPAIGTFTIGGLSGSKNLPLTDTLGNAITLQLVGGSYSGVMSGSGSLTKIGIGFLVLNGANTFTGQTSITGGLLQISNSNALQFSTVAANAGLKFNTAPFGYGTYVIGGLTGSGSLSLQDFGGGYAVAKVGNNNSDTVFGGNIAGPFGSRLIKVGTGTLTLTGVDSVLDTVNAGTLKVTGSLANNGSNSVYISAGTDFSSASIVRRVQSGGSYSGLGSTSTGSAAGLIGTSADIRAGQNNGASSYDMAMQWRVRNSNDVPAGLPALISDVLDLTGMSSTAGPHVQTDPFALQMTYSPAALNGQESVLAAEGLIDLARLDTSINQPTGLWRNATTGDFGTGLPGDVFQNVQSSWGAFAAANSITDANIGNFLGSYGVDPGSHTVWAVVNHNSQFAVVPEPSTWLLSLIALGGASLAHDRRRRTA